MRNILIILLVFILFSGCSTFKTVTFDKNNAKQINKVAILGPEQSNEISVNVTNDANIMYLMMGPAIIPQIMLAFATHQANRDEAIYLNELIFDFDIERIFREKFKKELVANTHFDPVLQDSLSDNEEIRKILRKYPKGHNDYITIANNISADTIIDVYVYSYGIKDPGIFWDPNVILTVDAKMIRIKDNKVLWQRRMTENTKRSASSGLDYIYYRENNAEILRFELEAAAEIVAKALVQDMGYEIEDGIGDVREIVAEKIAKALDEYKDSYQASYQVNTNSTNNANSSSGVNRVRTRLSPLNLNSRY